MFNFIESCILINIDPILVLTMATHLLITFKLQQHFDINNKSIICHIPQIPCCYKLKTNMETDGPLLKRWEQKQEHSQATLNSQRH
jgi:hypothetical protein